MHEGAITSEAEQEPHRDAVHELETPQILHQSGGCTKKSAETSRPLAPRVAQAGGGGGCGRGGAGVGRGWDTYGTTPSDTSEHTTGYSGSSWARWWVVASRHRDAVHVHELEIKPRDARKNRPKAGDLWPHG
jgi:hypothetical protein